MRVAKVLSVSRLAKVRSSLQLNWFDLSPGQELYEGDEVATMDRSDAILKFVDGQTVTLEPNSFLVLRSVGLAGGHDFQISLLRGGLQQQGGDESAGDSRSRLEIEVGGRKVVTQGQANLKIESGSGGLPEIAVGGGDVSVTEIRPNQIEIGRPAGPVAATTPAVAIPVEVKSPLLLSPATGLVLTNPETVRLSWKSLDASDAPTLVEVSRDEDFHEVLWHVILSEENSAKFAPEHKGRYFWRATRLGDEKHAASPVASFEVRRELRAPSLTRPRIEQGQADSIHPVDAPVLRHPVIHYQKEGWRPRAPVSRGFRLLAWLIDGIDAVFSAEARAADPEVTRYLVDLAWGNVPDATAYVLQISTDDDFQHVVAEKVLTQTSFSWHTDNAGFYYWRVSGVDKDGDRGPFSEFNTFGIKAERNKQGDESSYDTFRRFDDYSKYTQTLRVTWGPVFDNYYYVDPTNAPNSVIYHAHSLVNGQFSYDYRLSPYYSLQASVREEKVRLGASDFESRPDQPEYSQYETQMSIGVARRIFFPRHYFALSTGVRATFIDLPIDLGNGEPDDPLTPNNFPLIGFYLSAGYHRLLGGDFDGSVTLGGSYQSDGEDYRATQYASIEVRRRMVVDFIHVGIRVDEVLAAYRFNAQSLLLTGQAHMLTFRPAVFVDWSF